MKILVAEDDMISRRVIEQQLLKLGHEVVAAEDGASGHSKFLEHEPQVTITDWMMPDVDGLELCRRIRTTERTQYAYVIMLTALSGKENYLAGMDAGADDYLTKPVDMDQLKARLRVAERILSLKQEVSTLGRLLPICAWCKRVRDDKGYWDSVESYLEQTDHMSVSHGICPTCAEKTFGQYFAAKRKSRENGQESPSTASPPTG